MSVEVVGWNIGLPGWVKAMQAKGRPTDIPTSRYNGCKLKRSGIFTIENFETKTGSDS